VRVPGRRQAVATYRAAARGRASAGRRAAAAFAAVLVAAALGGCGSTAPARSGPLRVTLLSLGQFPFALEAANGFRWGVGQVGGVQQSVDSPTITDPIQQAQTFARLVRSGSSAGVAVWMQAPEQYADLASAAAEQHLPVLAIDSPPTPGTAINLYVGNDNEALGRQLASLIIDKLPPGATGRVVLGSPRPGAAPLDLRAAGIRAEFHDRMPKVQVLGPFDTAEQAHGARTAWQQLAAANPDALALLGVGADGQRLAALRSATHARWLAGSFDLDQGALQAVKRGQLVLLSPEQFLKGAVAGRLLAEHARDLRALPQGWIKIPGLPVTPATVDTVLRRQASATNQEAALRAELDGIFANGGPKVADLTLVQ
jgi:ribose transport system substrate-binding protein